jgi:hypothetical protein
MPRLLYLAIPLAMALAGIALTLTAARADIPPPPGTRERFAAGLIRGAGYACANVDRFEESPAGSGANSFPAELDVSVAVCSNGKRFVVGTPRRRPGPPRPDAPPPPQPVVRPLL